MGLEPALNYYVALSLNPSPRGRDLPTPLGLYLICFEVFRALDSLLYNWFLSGSGLMPLLNHHVTLSLNPEGLLADHDLLDQLVRQLHALRTDIAKILNRLFNVFVNDSVRLASMDSVQGKHGGLD